MIVIGATAAGRRIAAGEGVAASAKWTIVAIGGRRSGTGSVIAAGTGTRIASASVAVRGIAIGRRKAATTSGVTVIGAIVIVVNAAVVVVAVAAVHPATVERSVRSANQSSGKGRSRSRRNQSMVSVGGVYVHCHATRSVAVPVMIIRGAAALIPMRTLLEQCLGT